MNMGEYVRRYIAGRRHGSDFCQEGLALLYAPFNGMEMRDLCQADGVPMRQIRGLHETPHCLAVILSKSEGMTFEHVTQIQAFFQSNAPIAFANCRGRVPSKVSDASAERRERRRGWVIRSCLIDFSTRSCGLATSRE